MDNTEQIAAIAWAAHREGQNYGDFVAKLTPRQRDHIFGEYIRHKKAERARLAEQRRRAEKRQGEQDHRSELPPVKERSRGERYYTFSTAAAQSLYDEGYNDCQIAKELGMSIGAIRNWRCRQGLPPRAKRGCPRSKDKEAK